MTKLNLFVAEEPAVPTVKAPSSADLSTHFSFTLPHVPAVAAASACANYTAGYKKLISSQLEFGGVSARVDSMMCSSPTHVMSVAARAATAASFFGAYNDDDDSIDWMKRHPSALSSFEEISATMRGKQVVVFLDYDGTLSPIVNDPDHAYMSEEMRNAVKSVAKHFPTAIVSGRCIDKVFKFVNLKELYYAGSHGMDIKVPRRGSRDSENEVQPVLFQPASDFVPMIDEVYKILEEKTKAIPGSRVEHNKFCLSVHYRCLDEKKWSSLAEEVSSVLHHYPQLKRNQGRKVLEIKPDIEWNKGKAIEFLLESLGFGDSRSVFPIYIGDDRTDEDAFKVLRNRGQGLGILVSKHLKETDALYSLRDPGEVREFLFRLDQWKQL